MEHSAFGRHSHAHDVRIDFINLHVPVTSDTRSQQLPTILVSLNSARLGIMHSEDMLVLQKTEHSQLTVTQRTAASLLPKSLALGYLLNVCVRSTSLRVRHGTVQLHTLIHLSTCSHRVRRRTLLTHPRFLCHRQF